LYLCREFFSNLSKLNPARGQNHLPSQARVDFASRCGPLERDNPRTRGPAHGPIKFAGRRLKVIIRGPSFRLNQLKRGFRIRRGRDAPFSDTEASLDFYWWMRRSAVNNRPRIAAPEWWCFVYPKRDEEGIG